MQLARAERGEAKTKEDRTDPPEKALSEKRVPLSTFASPRGGERDKWSRWGAKEDLCGGKKTGGG